MGQDISPIPSGAVAALVVATAPAAPPQTRALLWRRAAGRALAAWPLRALSQLAQLDYCALITPPERSQDGAQALTDEALRCVTAVIPTASVTWRGSLASVADIPPSCEWIIALDAAEPLVTSEALRAGLRAAARTGVAIAGEPVKETLKRTQGLMVVETPPRASLMRLFAPVVFQRAALERALVSSLDARSEAGSETRSEAGSEARDVDDPDEADDLVALAQRSGAPLSVFAAGFPGVRLTAEEDLTLIETLLLQRQSRQSEAQPL